MHRAYDIARNRPDHSSPVWVFRRRRTLNALGESGRCKGAEHAVAIERFEAWIIGFSLSISTARDQRSPWRRPLSRMARLFGLLF
jgi:hypothetical protein